MDKTKFLKKKESLFTLKKFKLYGKSFIKKRSFAVYIVKMFKLHTKMFFTKKRSISVSKSF